MVNGKLKEKHTMGRELVKGSAFVKTPVIAIHGKGAEVGATFRGEYLGFEKELKIGVGKKQRTYFIHNFKILDTKGTTFSISLGDGKYKEVDVNPGERVNVFATELMHKTLMNFQPQEIIETEYLGKLKSKEGTEYHHVDFYRVTEDK